MGRHPNLAKIEQKMESGKSFSLTRSEYIKITGVDIPQDKRYTENNSAVAKRAHINGYIVKVVPEVIQFIPETEAN